MNGRNRVAPTANDLAVARFQGRWVVQVGTVQVRSRRGAASADSNPSWTAETTGTGIP